MIFFILTQTVEFAQKLMEVSEIKGTKRLASENQKFQKYMYPFQTRHGSGTLILDTVSPYSDKIVRDKYQEAYWKEPDLM